jgi:hypothetical protein
MLNKRELKSLIVRKGLGQCDVAKAIGITPKTFYTKMSKGVFGSDEIEIMIDVLDIRDPAAVFFAK